MIMVAVVVVMIGGGDKKDGGGFVGVDLMIMMIFQRKQKIRIHT